MDDVKFLQDLGVVVAAGAVGGWLARRAGLSVVVGYLLAGILVSPHLLGGKLIHDPGEIGTLAQLGLVFLMFGIGLQLSLKRMRQLGAGVVVATGLGALLVYNLGRAGAGLAGMEGMAPAFLAAALMVSSSAIISKVVEDGGLSHQRSGQEALGVTVLEDVVAVVMLSLLAVGSDGAGGQGASVLVTIGWLGVFVVAAVIGGLLLVPKLFGRVDASGDELRTLVVGALVLLMAAGAVGAGYSLALGAFLLGVVVAETSQRAAVARTFDGMRDLFSAVFFVSMGMLLDVRTLGDAWPWALGLAAAALVVRVFAATLALILVGRCPSDAVRTGLLLTPLGEFSFLMVQLGIANAVLPDEMFPAAIGASILTSLAAPVLARRGDWFSRALAPTDRSGFGRLVASYHALLGRVTEAAGSSWVWKPVRARLGWALMEVAITVALLAAARPVSALAAPLVEARLPVSSALASLAVWTAMAILAAVPLMAAWRNLSTVSLVLAEVAVRGLPRRSLLLPLADGGLRLCAALFLFNLLAGILPWEDSGGWIGLGAVVIALAAAALFGRRLMRLHHEAEIALRSQVDASAGSSEAPAWAEPAGAWPLQLVEVVLDETSRWRGASLRATELRPHTGCSVVQIERGGVCLLNPGPDERLFPGDKVLLAGDPERLEAARALLAASGGIAEVTETETALRTLTVADGAGAVGATLQELNLAHRTGAQVLGLRRGRERISPVPPAERLRVGDELLILGSTRQERSLQSVLAEG